MPYSTACSTSLANFEAGLNYKDVSDPAVMVGGGFGWVGGGALLGLGWWPNEPFGIAHHTLHPPTP